MSMRVHGKDRGARMCVTVCVFVCLCGYRVKSITQSLRVVGVSKVGWWELIWE